MDAIPDVTIWGKFNSLSADRTAPVKMRIKPIAQMWRAGERFQKTIDTYARASLNGWRARLRRVGNESQMR